MNNIMKLRCDDCNLTRRPILKMGGLLCSSCRVILKYPGTPEYKEYLDHMRKAVESVKK